MNFESQPTSDFIVEMYTLDNTEGDLSVNVGAAQIKFLLRSAILSVAKYL